MTLQKYIKMFTFIIVVIIFTSQLLHSQGFEIKLSTDNLVLPRSAIKDLEIYVNLKNVSSISLSIECDPDLYCYVPNQITFSGKFSLIIGTYLHTNLGEKIIILRANYSNQYENLKIRLYVTDYEISSKFYWVDAYIGDTLKIPFYLYLKDEDLINVTLHAVCPPSIECSLDKTWSTKSTNFTLYVNLSEDKCCYRDLYDICVRGISVGGSIKSKCLFISIRGKLSFDLSVSPNYFEILQGQQVSAKVGVQISGPLRVNLSIENCPPNATCSLSRTIFTSSGESILTISTTKNTPPGTYTITIRAIDNRSVSKTATFTLHVTSIPQPIPEPIPPQPTPPPIIADFNISLSITVEMTYQGSPVGVGVLIYVSIVGPLRVNLFIENCPPNSTCYLNQTEFVQNGTALLRILPTINTPPGIYYITIRAIDNRSVSKNVTLTLYVYEIPKPEPIPPIPPEPTPPEPTPPPQIIDFSISIHPTFDTIYQGSSSSAYVYVNITGPLRVNLSVLNCPPNATCSLNQTTFTQSGVALLRISTTQNTPPGTYTITIRAIDNRSITKFANLTLDVVKIPEPIIPPPTPPEPILLPPIVDFSISISPMKINLYQGQNATAKVNITIIGPLTVNLSLQGCPLATICYLDKTIFTKSGLATLHIVTTQNTPPGTYTITIRAIDNRSVSKTATFTLHVTSIPQPIPEPTPPLEPPKETRRVSLIGGVVGAQLIKEKDIIEIITVPEPQVFGEYVIKEEKVTEPVYTTIIKSEIKERVIYKPKEIKVNYLLDIIILILIIVVLIELLILLKRKING